MVNFSRRLGLTFRKDVFEYNSNSHHNPLIVSLLLLIFDIFVISKISKVSLIFPWTIDQLYIT